MFFTTGFLRIFTTLIGITNQQEVDIGLSSSQTYLGMEAMFCFVH